MDWWNKCYAVALDGQVKVIKIPRDHNNEPVKRFIVHSTSEEKYTKQLKPTVKVKTRLFEQRWYEAHNGQQAYCYKEVDPKQSDSL
jgi:hypothetical protein